MKTEKDKNRFLLPGAIMLAALLLYWASDRHNETLRCTAAFSALNGKVLYGWSDPDTDSHDDVVRMVKAAGCKDKLPRRARRKASR